MTDQTKHLMPLSEYTLYSPMSLPASVKGHPEFGETKQFFLDGILFETVELSPALTIRSSTGQKVFAITLDATLSTLKLSSGLIVRIKIDIGISKFVHPFQFQRETEETEVFLTKGEPFVVTVHWIIESSTFKVFFNDDTAGQLTLPIIYLDMEDITFVGDASVSFMGFTTIGIMLRLAYSFLVLKLTTFQESILQFLLEQKSFIVALMDSSSAMTFTLDHQWF